jgi:hypothetical protein
MAPRTRRTVRTAGPIIDTVRHSARAAGAARAQYPAMRTPRRSKTLLALLALAGLAACGACATSGSGPFGRDGAPPNARWVLFIGNSHTYVNDLPTMLRNMARMTGDETLRVEAIAEANYSLEDHWNAGPARNALTRYDWDFVVLQQGPSSRPENQLYLLSWTQQFAPLIRAAGAEPVLYQIWPDIYNRATDAAYALLSYTNAAAAVDGVLAPAGDAFTAALDADAAIGVYSDDGLHASVRGTYLAALTILARLNALDPRTLVDSIPDSPTPATVVQRLQDAAYTALQRNPARP